MDKSDGSMLLDAESASETKFGSECRLESWAQTRFARDFLLEEWCEFMAFDGVAYRCRFEAPISLYVDVWHTKPN